MVDILVEVGVRRLTQGARLDSEAARQAMLDIAESFCDTYRGTNIYVPRFAEPALIRRDEEIDRLYAQTGPDGVRPFTAERVNQLRMQFDLTANQIYCIVKSQRVRRASNCRSGLVPAQAATVRSVELEEGR